MVTTKFSGRLAQRPLQASIPPRLHLAVLSLLTLLVLGVGGSLAAPGAPALPPLQGPVVGIDTASQDRILLFDMTTGARRDLTFEGHWTRMWGFSPDGCRILYTQQDGIQPGALYSAKLDGSDRRLAAQYAGSETWGIWEPSWSPSLADPRIAFTLIRISGDQTTHHVGYVEREGGSVSLYSVTGDEHTARWSPDSRWLVYTAYETRAAGSDVFATAEPGQNSSTQLREADLWIVSADGTTKYRLTNFPTGSVTMPRWSPDGDLIGFVYSASPGFDTVWMIGMTPNAVPTQLTYAASLILDLTWQPDSAALVMSARGFNGVEENRLWRLALVGGADSSAQQVIADQTLRYHDYPRYSADGRWLALRGEYGLALVDTADDTWHWLERDQLGGTPPYWSPAAFASESSCG